MPSYTTAVRNARLDAIVTAVGTSGLVNVYSGSVPTNVGTALSGQTLLGTCTLAATAGTPSGGVLTFNTITQDSSADASGTPTFARVTTSGGTAVAQVTAAVGSGELNFGAAITAGQPLQITSFTITEGNP